MKKNIAIKKITQLTGHNGGIFTLAKGMADHLFLSGAGDGWLVEWDLRNPENGRLIAQAEDTQVSGRASIFALCATENALMAGNMNGGLHWVFPENVEANKDILHHKKGIYDAQVFDNELFTSGGDGVLTRWSLSSQRAIESIHLSHESLRRMAFSSNRNELVVGASDGNIYFLDRANFSLKNMIEGAHGNSVFTVKYSPDEKKLLSGGRDALLKVWDLEQDYQEISSQAAHWFTINDLVFHPDGKIFATASRDKTIKIWDASTYQLLKVLDANRQGGHVNSVNALLWSKYNNWLISGSDDRSLIIWEIEIS